MGERQPVKKKKKKFGLFMQQNLLAVFLIVLLAFVGLIVRLVYLNYSVGDKYEKRVLSQQTYMSNAIAFKRGSILDRNGTVLAESIRVYNLILDPLKMQSQNGEYVEPTLKALMKCFEVKEEEVRTILKEKAKSQYVVFQKLIEAEKVEAFKAIQENDKNVQGVWFEDAYKRVYPLKSLACDVVGFNTGGTSTGIESYYNDELTGEDGREYGYFDSDLNLERVVKEATNGNTVVSAIDANIQQIVEKHVAKFNKETGSKNTAVLVMDPRNGEVLAMTSGKQYDLNQPQDLSGIYSKKKLAKMTEEQKLEALNNMWRNFIVSDTFEPGSTFKPVTVAAGLEEAFVKEKTTFYCGGSKRVADRNIHCAVRAGHGTITLSQALMYSCNVALMEIAEKLGPSRMYHFQTNLMFGSRTGIDLPAEATGIIFQKDKIGPTELATLSFGQGFNTSMIQIASAFSSLINGGNYFEPHVLKETRSDSGATIRKKGTNLIKKSVSDTTSGLIRKFLHETVEDGTATAAKIDGYTIGGKTGTAEKYPRGSKKYLVSFIGFAPADNPEAVIYCVVDEPDVADQAHSTFASQLFHDIAQEVYPFLGISKTPEALKQEEKEQAEKEKEEKKKKQEKSEAKKPEAEDGKTPSGTVLESVGDEEAGVQDDVDLPIADETTGASDLIR
ncbi:peptidoglycan D,D-transpeptidase FtsI family protein [[Clostridium] polysaccharolyticum]|uniref:Stage V sporulation protein D (Sporulation-specific penicillin-binding protein) n=1 Tax=[Clostridium] polysaccharolyticum TaxID=29364 RepID=A0A1H9Y198_9FIRM|nr:penicillin-binding transpeptidase domain-containing protein [[Clostridium] polysaccharolyticum]SES62400.1 stage V sporulation protein D (sporulation-specific penicillin-binding protein) [[Clostridium] polysaccharolyticum]